MFYSNNKTIRTIITIVCVVMSSFVLTISLQSFAIPGNIISGGFTGIALLLNQFNIMRTNIAIVVLNLPVAFICYRYLSKRFTIYSVAQIVLTSIMLQFFSLPTFFDDLLLNAIFGGIFYGLAVVIAMIGDASTGGTDFVALYFSSRFNKSTWNYVFISNIVMILILAYSSGWTYAGYSIIFQYVTTMLINQLHRRYKRVELQIFSSKPELILAAYNSRYHHGTTVLEGYGGYSKQKRTLIITVISVYEINEVIRMCKSIEEKVIINVLKSENFIGDFYHRPFD